MAFMPKDYSRHENKILGNLSFKSLLTISVFAALAMLTMKMTFIPIVVRVILIIPLLVIALFCLFYRTQDGDDFITYIFNLLVYYSSPKYLVYKKQLYDERKKKVWQKRQMKK